MLIVGNLTTNPVALEKENQNRFNTFKTAPLDDWEVAAREELNGADPWERLTHKSGGLSILPYYDQKKLNPAPTLPVSKNDFSGPRSWFNCPAIRVSDAKKANEKALQSLKDGADGILFELIDEVNFDILLFEIEWKYCSLNFFALKNQHALAEALDKYISSKKLDTNKIHGAFFGNTAANGIINKDFFFNGFQFQPSASVKEEIANGFKEIIKSKAASHVAISITLDNDFFLSIAKVRSIHLLWKKYGDATNAPSAKVFIHALSPAWIDKDFQPHGNMLKGTYAAMAAILGGCDALTIQSEDADNSTMSRAARNISNILREESYFSKVADPLAGSYFIEDLSRQVTDAVWDSIKTELR
ncbi:hypothetical protein BH09BAC3_BH09BAC3_35050 [soil metagenome]